jgi:hypothetical protein
MLVTGERKSPFCISTNSGSKKTLLRVGLQFTTSKAQVLHRRKPQPNILWMQTHLG